MQIVINAYINMVLEMTGVGLDKVMAAYSAHQIDEDFHHCSCGKSFDSNPVRFFNHLSGSVAARAKVHYSEGQFVVNAISNESMKVQDAQRSVLA